MTNNIIGVQPVKRQNHSIFGTAERDFSNGSSGAPYAMD